MPKKLLQYFVLYSFLVIFSQNTFANPQVIFAVDLIRHGDRTPLHDISSAKYSWPNGLGMLTKKGENQLISLGRSQGNKYINTYKLLSRSYDTSKIMVVSTDFKRTIASANAFIKGLYPAASINKFNINVLKDKTHNFLITQPQRDVFSTIKLYILKQYFWHQAIYNLKPLLKQWSVYSGMDLLNYTEFMHFADNLYVRNQHGVPLPKWITQEDADKVIRIMDQMIVFQFKQKEVIGPSGKIFLATLKGYFSNKIANNTHLNYVLLSGHDSSLMTALSILGVPANHNPPYASDINFLLLKDNKHYYVSITFNNKPLYIPVCGATSCTIEQFNALASR